ncbi:MAG: sulfotransferase [Gammaproteobacteria bacterium]|nr:sulfotransferase [Gammaproteobacteria bacterium]
MNSEIVNLSNAGRQAAVKQDWPTAHACAAGILSRAPKHPDGMFLMGLVEKAARRPRRATAAFEAVLAIDASRYDAAVELAGQYSMARRNGDVAELLGRYEDALANSPRYLDMAATVYTEIGMPEKAWPLYRRAQELQPDIPLFQANLAACAVFVGEIETARRMYLALLEKNPTHQRNHYHLARLERAKDTQHIEQMQAVLRETKLPPDRNVFLHYALGKEYEDLEEWDKAFDQYKQAGDAVVSVARYNVEDDIAIIDKVIEVCSGNWLRAKAVPSTEDKTPLFVVGLPRTGTTLTERIIASHSKVQSVGETEFIQMVMRRESDVESVEKMNPAMLDAVANKDISLIRDGYLDVVRYRLGEQPIFIDKLPFNVLYLGFIAKAWPDQPIVLMHRNPMDACFSMYKQVFTWAYKFSYDLDTLGRYYIAYERLCRHWRALLGERLVEVKYEELVSDQEAQTRRLLDRLGLEFEEACLEFEKNRAPTATASSVQVREKVHTGSIGRWKRYEKQLEPLRQRLEAAGIATG